MAIFAALRQGNDSFEILCLGGRRKIYCSSAHRICFTTPPPPRHDERHIQIDVRSQGKSGVAYAYDLNSQSLKVES